MLGTILHVGRVRGGHLARLESGAPSGLINSFNHPSASSVKIAFSTLANDGKHG
jgi:hypothetical protein